MQRTSTYSNPVPDYKAFKNLSEVDQLEYLLLLATGFTQAESIRIKSLINAVFYDDADNAYFKKKCLEIYAYGVYQGFFQAEGLVEKISDLTVGDESFILEFALKCLYRLHLFFTTSLATWLENMIFHTRAEVRSEAYHCRARLHFYQGLGTRDMAKYYSELTETISDCQRSIVEIESRTDAEILLAISEGLKVIAFNQADSEYDRAIATAKLSLKKFINFNAKPDEIIYFVNILNAMSAIRRITKTDPSSWLEVRKELISLLVNIQQIDITSASNNPKQNTASQSQMFILREGLVKELLLPRLRNDIYRLKRLEEEGLLETTQQTELLKIIIDWLDAETLSDNAREFNLNVFTKFHDAFPEIDAGKLKERLDSLNLSKPDDLLGLFIQMTTEQAREKNIAIATGTSTGDEMLGVIVKEINSQCLGYKKEKLLEASLVLRDVINYLINAMRGSKREFPFLFENNAKEVQLQDSMMVYLKASDRSAKYIPEVKDFADGGRVDIVFKSELLELPIELKRSFDTVTWEKVKSDYIAQAQTYANTRDQLAIFITMDLSTQTNNKPETGIRNLFKVFSLQGRQEVGISYPDYVIAFVLPGNKLLPSQRANYS